MVGSGEIDAEPSGDSLMIDYRLSLYEPFVITGVLVSLWKITNLASKMSVPYLVVVWFASSVILAVSAVIGFSKFLRQFPRNDAAPE